MPLRVLSAVLFYPRGGSAHATRALARELRAQGCEVTLVAGSRSGLGGHGDARRFYGDVHAVDFDPALDSGDPLRFEGPAGTAPMHPSFEDRPGAPDAVFASLDDGEYERQVSAWARELGRAGAAGADVAYLHHLTPLNEAIARAAPDVPVVAHLHGTELLMLERIEAGAPASWRHAEAWAERMRAWAARAARLVVTPSSADRAQRMLAVEAEKVVSLASGVDLSVFSPRDINRREFWHRTLVESPQGWGPGEDAGSVAYEATAVERLATATVLIYVGRFTAVKRLDTLIETFARANGEAQGAAGLVLVGGHPGEWEGEHPADLAQRLDARDVFLAGWYDHEDLPDFFAAADVVVTTSEREQFGLVLVEGMACGLPVIATRSPGPELILAESDGGWLVEPDDEDALTAVLVEAIDDPGERRRRGAAALETARERFSWEAAAGALREVLEEVAAEAGPVNPGAPGAGSPARFRP